MPLDPQAIADNPDRYKTLANGAVYDLTIGRIVANPGGGTAAITGQNSSAYHARRQQLKRETIAQAANDAVENGTYTAKYKDLAFVAAIAATAMQKATTPDDPKAIDAARFLLQEAGLAEAKQQQPDQVSPIAALPPGYVMMIARLADGMGSDVIDSTAHDVDEETRG
jgi:hypothetical protein